MKKIISAILSLVIILSFTAVVSFAEDSAKFSVVVPELHDNDTDFTAVINVTNIPECGLSGIKISLEFDTALSIIGVVNGESSGESMAGPITAADGAVAGKFSYAWVGGIESVNDDFTLCSVTFKLPESIKVGDSWEIKFVIEEDDVFNVDLNNVGFTAENGVATVVEKRCPGDANDDNSFNAKDASIVAKLLAGWTVQINMTNADVNRDGTVNAKDLSLMLKSFAGWDVEIG